MIVGHDSGSASRITLKHEVVYVFYETVVVLHSLRKEKSVGEMINRLIGFRHRRKATKEGEARPTQVAIRERSGKIHKLDLATDDDELDFVHGRLPKDYRNATPDDDSKQFKIRHLKTRRLKKEEDPATFPANLLIKEGREYLLVTKVPTAYTGLMAGDVAVMVMGGSGDRLAYAMANPRLSITVFRIPPFHLSAEREGEKDDDPQTLIRLFEDQPKLYYKVEQPALEVIQLKNYWSLREDAMKARIACEQRILASLVGRIYCNHDGGYQEGGLEVEFQEAMANDRVLQALLEEEKQREKTLTNHLQQMPLYREVFQPIEGLGPMMAARLIKSIGTVLRFEENPHEQEITDLHAQKVGLKKKAGCYDAFKNTDVVKRLPANPSSWDKEKAVLAYYLEQGLTERVKQMDEVIRLADEIQKLNRRGQYLSANNLKKYCGVHVMEDGTFPRRRHGQVASWQPDCRQALYLLFGPEGQAVRRVDSESGLARKHNKELDRLKHPEVEAVDGKKRFTNGHIHKRATWRTASQFVEVLYKRWSRWERTNGILNVPDDDEEMEVVVV